MAVTLEELQIRFTAQMGNLSSQINGLQRGLLSMSSSAGKAKTAMSTLAKTAKLFAGLYIVKQMISVGKESLKMANNAVESENLFAVAMGGMADEARAWSDDLSASLGLNAYSLRKNVGTFNTMFVSMGMGTQKAYDMSVGMTQLAEDMASFYNLDSEEAFSKLRAGITGETEPLKRLGILVDENTIKQVALRNGLISSGQEMSQQTKLQARYIAIMEQTANAQGDLARTIDSPVNQIRILGNAFDMVKITLGQAFQPIQAIVIPILMNIARAAQVAANAIKSFLWVLTGFKGIGAAAANITGKGAESSADLADSLNETAEGYKKAGGAAKKASKDAKIGLKAFDEINKLTEKEASSGGGGGIGEKPETPTPPAESSQAWETFNGAVSKAAEWLKKLWEQAAPTREALGRLWEAIKGLAGVAWDNIKLFYDTVLKPIGEWVVTKGAPAFLDALSSAINLVKVAVEAARPAFVDFYENLLKPLGVWAGNAVVNGLKWLKEQFDKLAAWIKENPETFTKIVGGLIAIKGALLGFQLVSWLTSLNPTMLLLAAIAAAVLLIVTNWDAIKAALEQAWNKMKELWGQYVTWVDTNIVQPIQKLWAQVQEAGKKIVEEIKLAWAAFVTWVNTNIVAPIKKAWDDLMAFLGMKKNIDINVNILETTTKKTIYQRQVVEGPNPIPTQIGEYEVSLPGLAAGGVFTPNRPFVGILGDQKYGKNIETPESLMRNIFRDEIYRMSVSPASASTSYNAMETSGVGNLVQRAVEAVLDRLNVSLVVDGQTFGKASIRSINDVQRRAGQVLLQM